MEQNNAEKTGLKFWKTEKNSNATDKNAIKHKINVSKCEQEKEKTHISVEKETTKKLDLNARNWIIIHLPATQP